MFCEYIETKNNKMVIQKVCNCCSLTTVENINRQQLSTKNKSNIGMFFFVYLV